MVAQRIDAYIKDNGYGRKTIAALANMKYSAFLSALAGKRKLSVEEYIKICNALNVPLTSFLDKTA